LSALKVARLEQLLTGTLDLCSYRLDAWITSFATKRLAEMPAGESDRRALRRLRLGDELEAGGGPNPGASPPGEQGPIFQPANNPGFVHTPSLTQAATVAVLRSGHLAHSGRQMPSDLLAIDLSSSGCGSPSGCSTA